MLKIGFHCCAQLGKLPLQCRHLLAVGSTLSTAIRHSSSGGSGGSNDPGLFGMPRLQTHADFPRWAQDAKDRCNELVQQILAAPADASVVRLVDDISDQMCQVYDSAECCRNVHPDPQWQQAASQACQVLGNYLAEINHHEGLYNKLVAVQDLYTRSRAAADNEAAPDKQLQQQLLSHQQLSAFCPETVVVAAKYLQDFEKFGIHLQDKQQRQKVAQLLALNQHYPARFNAVMADPAALGTASVPAQLLPGSWGLATSLTGQVRVPLDSGSVHYLLSHTDSAEARKQVYLAAATSPEANLSLLTGMLGCRHKLARLLGYTSYAHFKASDSTLAGSPGAAESFLVDLADQCRAHADKELALLTHMKRQHTGDSGAVFQPWDQDYYTRQLATQACGPAAAAVAAFPYLQLGSVLAGLSELLDRLMGLQLQQQPLSAKEAWAQGLVKLAVVCCEHGPLGTLYLDLVARPGKVPSSGILYPVRCGRELPGGMYQQPILCLVGNVAAAHGIGSATATQLLLSWKEFKTLLHEMGHAVHSMVSRTKYQHVWGTRCAQDIVEVPSHLWEHFASDSRCLALLARHKSSREPLPAQLAQQLACRTSATPALELQQQALMSLVDLVYHGHLPPSSAHESSSVWLSLAHQHSSLPPPQTTSPQARFSHLTIYGASYYSYLYARCLSEAIWDTHLLQDPLNPHTGQLIKELLLKPGGSLEPLDLLTSVLGGPVQRDKVLQARHGGWCPKTDHLVKRMIGSTAQDTLHKGL